MMAQRTVILAASAKLLVDAAVLTYTTQHVPGSYMDEPFHVGQTQEYCVGRYFSWDPKITTFPGLYVLGLLWSKLLALAQLYLHVLPATLDLCGTFVLRSVNVLLATACLPVLHAILVQQQQHQSFHTTQHNRQFRHPAPGSAAPTWLWCLTLSCIPLHWFYTYLYYTDVGSNLFLLLCFQQSQDEHYWWAAAAGGMAVLFRQTNAVWVGFVAGAAALRILSKAQTTMIVGSRRSKRQAPTVDVDIRQQQQPPHPPSSTLQELIHAWDGIRSQGLTLLSTLFPLLLVPAAFAVFMVYNQGVAVGDRAAHAPVRHAAQLVYFILFAAVMLGPMMLGYARAAVASLVKRPAAGALCVLCLWAASMAALSTSPPPHPYLMADNRHYTFYVWRRLLSRAAASQIALVAGLAAAVLIHAMCRVQQRLLLLGFTVCLTAVLVPAWLLEFRYYTAGVLLLAVHLPAPSTAQALFTLCMYMTINLVTLHLFVHKPFTWADGSTARFMW